MSSASNSGRSLEDGIFATRRIAPCAALLVVCYALVLAILAGVGGWFSHTGDYTPLSDFVVFWPAGQLALRGNAAAAYDLATLGAIEMEAVPGTFPARPWVYPPTFLLAVVPFAFLPYFPAFLAWLSVTLSAYLAAIHAVIPRRLTILLALASPPVLWNLVGGQNGFLSAALLGGSLVFMNTRPIVAGAFLGLLTYKPQFGLLFPLVLVLTGRWRVMGSAAVTALVFAGASYLAFGVDAWEAFLRSASLAAAALFTGNWVLWSHLQTIFGLVRWLGGGETAAWTAQGLAASATAAIVCWIWLRPVAYPLKAAALATGALLVPPYLLMYDWTAVAVSAAFLVKDGLLNGFLRGERSVLSILVAALLYPLVGHDFAPLGPLLLAALMGLIVVRVVRRARSW